MKGSNDGRILRNRALINKNTNAIVKPKYDCKQRGLRNRALIINSSVNSLVDNCESLKENVDPLSVFSKASDATGHSKMLNNMLLNQTSQNDHSLSEDSLDKAQGDLTVTLQQNFKNKTPLGEKIANRFHNDVTKFSLTKENIKSLQMKILKNEAENFNCGHFICSHDNRKQLDSTRLWFLFELEMSYDAAVNLRSTCYFNQVYKRIDPLWKMETCFSNEILPDGFEYFAMEQLNIPKVISSHSKNKSNKQSEKPFEDISVNIEDAFEHEPEQIKIPPSLLSKRNKKEIFDQDSVHTQEILNVANTSTFSIDFIPEMVRDADNDGEETKENHRSQRKKDQSCRLEKKLAIMGGLKTPRLKSR